LKFVAIIPARAGSKGIKNKNLRKISGKSLVEIAILEAKKSKYISKIIVSTDSPEIFRQSVKLNANSTTLRPKKLSDDIALVNSVVLHEIEVNKINTATDIIVLLQPTSPLRDSNDIDNAIELFIKMSGSIVSVSKVAEHPLFMREIDQDGRLINILKKNSTIRRQDLSEVYTVNGAIYINYAKDYKTDLSPNDNMYPYIMPIDKSVDVNHFEDLIKARSLYKIKNRPNS
jgi:CMP-N,N'-diacetyllegionaminic acid synthase